MKSEELDRILGRVCELEVSQTVSRHSTKADCFAAQYCNDFVRFEVFTAVIMKNGVFWDVTPCGSYKNRRFGGT
jgi:hypothetical protein